MKMKIITIFIIVIAQTITQVFCYARESCKEFHETSSSISNSKEALQSSTDDGYISFTLDNESQKTLSYGFGTWNHYKGNKYTTVSAFDSSFSEKIIIAFDSNSKGTYRVSSRRLFNQIHYYSGSEEIMIAVGTKGEGAIKVTNYGSVGDFITGSFNGILVDYSTNSAAGVKYARKKHRIRGTFKVKRLSNIKKSVSYKTGIAGINGLDSISADRTSENTSIINTTIKAPFHHSTPTLLPVPTPSSQPTSCRGKEGMVYGTVIDTYGDTLEGVMVTIVGEGISASTETDEDGYYESQGLAAGNYTLTCEKEGYVTQTQEISLEEGETIDFGTTTMLRICSFYGYIVDNRGEPIVHLRICLTKKNSKECTYTDADGFFELNDLEAGTYLIFLRAKGYLPKKIRVKLEEGEAKDIGEITLRRKS